VVAVLGLLLIAAIAIAVAASKNGDKGQSPPTRHADTASAVQQYPQPTKSNVGLQPSAVPTAPVVSQPTNPPPAPTATEPPPPPGAVLCTNYDCYRFETDAASFPNTGLGSDPVVALQQLNGVRVSLFTESGFQGKCQTLTEPVTNLQSTEVGYNAASLWINKDCPAGAVLCTNFHCYRFETDAASFPNTGLGSDPVVALQQLNGVRVSLFTESGFRGKCQTLTEPVTNLQSTEVGYNAASLRINKDCP
jgi:hypothetical protein